MGPRRARFPAFPVFPSFPFFGFPCVSGFPPFSIFFSSRNPISPRGGPPTPRNHQYSYRNIDGFEAGPAAGPQPPPRSTFQRFSPKSWKFAEIRPQNAGFAKMHDFPPNRASETFVFIAVYQWICEGGEEGTERLKSA